ncbi:hypothetical protein B0H11DRAFT_2076965 [Mycena galericulata]|nr:hypothetical protein B0H11DRAFT_2076965 [Mycena galericulata]
MSVSDKNLKALVAFPSVTTSLNTLPRATSLSHVSLHHSMYAHWAKESEAKLQHALVLNPISPLPFLSKPPTAAPLMMRTSVSARWRVR